MASSLDGSLKERSTMSYRIYVGNLAYQATEQELEELFGSEGSKVESAKIINDLTTGRSRGFAFVELSSHAEMEREVRRLNGFVFKGRNLVVSEAKQQEGRRSQGSKWTTHGHTGGYGRSRY
jgi:cold-inducible RNA-binding protein